MRSSILAAAALAAALSLAAPDAAAQAGPADSVRVRRSGASGHLVSREQIERQNPREIADALRGVPGVRLERVAGGTRVLMMGNNTFARGQTVGRATREAPRTLPSGRASGGRGRTETGGAAGNAPQPPASFEGAGRGGPADCTVAFFLDGQPISAPGGVLPDQIPPSSVEAMEVFTRARDVPPQYRRDGQCGVVLIWSRGAA